MQFKLIKLQRALLLFGEERMNEILSSFSCPLNPDIEHFLEHNALNFTKQGIAVTYLLLDVDKLSIFGYFSLANKPLSLSVESVDAMSNMWSRRIKRFSVFREDIREYTFSSPLIGQLGRNMTFKSGQPITGSELLDMACGVLRATENHIGGKIIHIECADNPKLIAFYENNEFWRVPIRTHVGDGENGEPDILVQMIRWLDFK